METRTPIIVQFSHLDNGACADLRQTPRVASTPLPTPAPPSSPGSGYRPTLSSAIRYLQRRPASPPGSASRRRAGATAPGTGGGGGDGELIAAGKERHRRGRPALKTGLAAGECRVVRVLLTCGQLQHTGRSSGRFFRGGGGALVEGTQVRVPLKLKIPRIYATIFGE